MGIDGRIFPVRHQASMPAIKTRVVAFDTSIVDLSDKCDDPVRATHSPRNVEASFILV